MVPWWKRLIFSILSVLVGVCVAGLASEVVASLSGHFDSARLLVSTVIFLIYSAAGWIVAAPIIISVRNYRGWRLWGWGVIGISIGPAVIVGFGLFSFLTLKSGAGFWSGMSDFLLFAALISMVSTCVYLFLVTRRGSQ